LNEVCENSPWTGEEGLASRVISLDFCEGLRITPWDMFTSDWPFLVFLFVDVFFTFWIYSQQMVWAAAGLGQNKARQGKVDWTRLRRPCFH
jgi:hypothetical protein